MATERKRQIQRQVMESREVRELRGKIVGMEMELNLLSKDLERFKAELFYNIKMLDSTNENISFLKNSDAAVSLSEYRKIKQQKVLLDMRVRHYSQKISPLEQVLDIKEKYLDEDMKKFEEVYRIQFTNNVLEFSK